MANFWDTFTGGLEEGKKMFTGDPGAIKKAYDDMMAKASGMTADTRNFLGGQEQKALQFYAPLQHMFQGAYGTEGIQAPQIPQSQGPLARMYGGK